MNELRINGERVVHLGLLPKISIDARIRCPCRFTDKDPPPSPPTQRYVEIACRAASKIATAMWPFRKYIEVIKVGYILSRHYSENVNISGEVILVVPTTDEKMSVQIEEQLSGQDWRRNESERVMRYELLGPDEEYEVILTRFAEDLLFLSQKAIQERQSKLNSSIAELQEFMAFGSSKGGWSLKDLPLA